MIKSIHAWLEVEAIRSSRISNSATQLSSRTMNLVVAEMLFKRRIEEVAVTEGCRDVRRGDSAHVKLLTMTRMA